MSWVITVPVGPGECPVSWRCPMSFMECPLRSISPKAEPGYAMREEGRGRVWKVIPMFSVLPVWWLPRLLMESGMESHGRYEDHGSFQVPDISQTIMCPCGGVPHDPGIGYLLPHGRPYTRGFSVSEATPSTQTSFFFFPGEEIRKKVTPPMFGILTSLAWHKVSES